MHAPGNEDCDDDGLESDCSQSSTEMYLSDAPTPGAQPPHTPLSLTSFDPIFRMIKSVSLQSSAYIIRGRISEAERKAVIQCARRVEKFLYEQAQPIPAADAIFVRLAKLPHSDRPFFPCLKELSIGRFTLPTASLALFLTPSLQRLALHHIPNTLDDELANFLHSLVDEAVALSSLEFGPRIESTKCLSVLVNFTTLSSVNISLPGDYALPFDLSILDQLGHLPALTRLRIKTGRATFALLQTEPLQQVQRKPWENFPGNAPTPHRDRTPHGGAGNPIQNRFPRLQNLDVTGRLELVHHILQGLRRSPLRILDVTLIGWEPPPAPGTQLCMVCQKPPGWFRRFEGVCSDECAKTRISTASEYFNTLIESFLRNSLGRVATIRLGTADRQETAPDSWTISSKLLRACLGSPMLTTLHVFCWAIGACELDSILNLKHNALSILWLPMDTCPDIHLSTLRSLVSGCPTLTSLQCRIKLEDVGLVDEPVSHGLRRLIAGTSEEGWRKPLVVTNRRKTLISVARQLHRLFPALRETVGKGGHCKEEWEEVFELLKLFQEVVAEEKQRSPHSTLPI